MKQYNFFKIAVLSSILLIGTTGCEDFLTKRPYTRQYLCAV